MPITYISNIPDERATINENDYIVIDNPIEQKTYKLKITNILQTNGDGKTYLNNTGSYANPNVSFTLPIDTPITEITIEHNLGHKPVVHVYDIDGEEISALIRHIDTNSFIIQSNVPFIGEVSYK
jgi:hypothetical protein